MYQNLIDTDWLNFLLFTSNLGLNGYAFSIFLTYNYQSDKDKGCVNTYYLEKHKYHFSISLSFSNFSL